MRLISSCLLALTITGCVSAQDQLSAVRNRASFDFDCPPDKVQITLMNSSLFGAEGCRQRQVYETRGTTVYKEGMAPVQVYNQPHVGIGYGYHRYYR